MKTCRLTVVWVLGALCGVVSPLARADGPLVAHPTDVELSAASVLISKKGTRTDILNLLGEPPTRLSPEVWVYWNFRSTQPTRTPGLDTLLITFDGARIRSLKLVEGAPVRRFIASQGNQQAAQQLTSLYADRTPKRR